MRPTIGRGPLATICGLALAGLLCPGCRSEIGELVVQPSTPIEAGKTGSVRIDPPKNVPGGAKYKWQGNEFVTVNSQSDHDLTVPFHAERPGQGRIDFWIEVDGKELQGSRRICMIEVRGTGGGLKRPPEEPRPTPIAIPQSAAWQAQGGQEKGDSGTVRDSRYEHGRWTITAALTQPDAYVQLLLDLTQVPLEGIERNADETYNLAGYTLVAQVMAGPEFVGGRGMANGAQWILYDPGWAATAGNWQAASPAMRERSGQTIAYTVPKGLTSVAGIAVKFTLGSHSTTVIHGGTFNVLRVTIKPPASP